VGPDRSGSEHVIDASDQLGQVVEVNNFAAGDLTVRGAYLIFLGNLADTAIVHVESGARYSVLVPVARVRAAAISSSTVRTFSFPSCRPPKSKPLPSPHQSWPPCAIRPCRTK
jgi:hypothetical protein